MPTLFYLIIAGVIVSFLWFGVGVMFIKAYFDSIVRSW